MIDLRSDTVTQPSAAMLEAMHRAPTGDDVYGEDPSVNALEARVAALAGKQAGLFVSSGTQSNLIALLTHCGRGEEYLVGQAYHTYLHEAGGAATLGGIQPQPMAVGDDGSLDLALVESLIKPDDSHFARTRLLVLENTHHGKVIGLDYLAAARQLVDKRGLGLHLDGARVFNAAVALGVELEAISRYFDTISICFSKGLGTPVGSVLCGPQSFIDQARRYRKMLGGGMRQVGILAAAADFALDHHVEDLALDHANAALLSQRLAALVEPMDGVELEAAQTNILYLHFSNQRVAEGMVERLAEQLAARGIRISPSATLRLVLHRDIDRAQTEQVAEAFEQLLPSLI